MPASPESQSRVPCKVCNRSFATDAAYRKHVARSDEHERKQSELDRLELAGASRGAPPHKRHASDVGGRPTLLAQRPAPSTGCSEHILPTAELAEDHVTAAALACTAAASVGNAVRATDQDQSTQLQDIDSAFARDIPGTSAVRTQPSTLRHAGRMSFSRQQLQSAQLSSTAVGLLGPLLALTGQHRDELVRLLKQPNFSVDDVPWSSGQEVNTFLDSKQVDELLWLACTISCFPPTN